MNFLELCRDFVSDVGIAGGEGPSSTENQTGEMKNVVRWIRDSALYIDNLWRDWRYLHRIYDTATSNEFPPMPALPAFPPVKEWHRDSIYINYGTSTVRQLAFVEWDEWRVRYGSGITVGTPSEFTVRPDRQICLNHRPPTTINFHGEYWKRPTPLSGNAAVPDLPEDFHRLIVVRAEIYYGNREGAGEIISGAEAEYMDLLEKLESAEIPAFRNDRMGGQDIDLAVRPAYRGGGSSRNFG